jgi:hypothetical protein
LKGGTGGAAGTIIMADAGAASGGAAGNAPDAALGAGGSRTGGAQTGGKASGGAIGMDAAGVGGMGGGGLATGGATTVAATGGRGIDGGVAGGSTGHVATGGAATGGAGTGAVATGGAGTGGAGTGGATGRGTGGTPAGAALELDSSRMDFGTMTLGTTRVASFTVTNRGASTSGLPVVTTQPTGTPNPLTVTGCGAALAAHASCVLTIAVTPRELGLFQGWVRITAEPGTQPYLSIYVVGSVIGFEMSSPSSVDFGVLAPGVLRQHGVTVTALIALSDLEVWTGGDEVSVNPSATTCTATLAAGASCGVTVDFIATEVGWKEGSLGVRAGGDTGQFARVAFTANVSKGSGLDIAPKQPPTYACVFEQTSPPVVFTVTNVSTTTSGAISSTLVGEFARDYAVSDTNCTTLAPQATCTVSVVCRPAMSASAAARAAILSVTDGNTQLSVPLNGQVSF